MRRADIARHALPWTFSLAVFCSLHGCDAELSVGFGDQAPVRTYTVGGTTSGLAPGATVTLMDNNSDSLTVSANGAFSFTRALARNAGYAVAVGTQPGGQTCTVSGGVGTIGSANVASVVVTCTDQAYISGGTVEGLNGSGLVIGNESATVTLPAGADTFSFPTAINFDTPYDVTVEKEPSGLYCTVNQGSGTMPAHAVTNVAVVCSASTDSILHSLSGPAADGSEPWYGNLLLASDGNFYGMTAFGGVNDNGTVFKMTPAGVETVLWSFGNGNDGSNPFGSLIQGSDGDFYGMTYLGGDYQGYVGSVYHAGTIFKITPAGVETVIWSLGNGNDGSMPYGNLVLGGDGDFYGTTYAGGVSGQGTVLRFTAAGAESVLWSFGASGDGAHPTGSPTLGMNGNLYGMTIDGGTQGMGVAYTLAPDGPESVLHSFGQSGDGYEPQGSLIQGMDGNFYGVAGGGAAGWGVILQITPIGTEKVLYSFGAGPIGSGADGESPFGGLIQGADGTFYGMTSRGGASDKGTVFSFK